MLLYPCCFIFGLESVLFNLEIWGGLNQSQNFAAWSHQSVSEENYKQYIIYVSVPPSRGHWGTYILASKIQWRMNDHQICDPASHVLPDWSIPLTYKRILKSLTWTWCLIALLDCGQNTLHLAELNLMALIQSSLKSMKEPLLIWLGYRSDLMPEYGMVKQEWVFLKVE